MYVNCIDDGGFEDQLSVEKTYQVLEQKNNSYLIINDNEEKAWYGTMHFTVEFC